MKFQINCDIILFVDKSTEEEDMPRKAKDANPVSVLTDIHTGVQEGEQGIPVICRRMRYYRTRLKRRNLPG